MTVSWLTGRLSNGFGRISELPFTAIKSNKHSNAERLLLWEFVGKSPAAIQFSMTENFPRESNEDNEHFAYIFSHWLRRIDSSQEIKKKQQNKLQ